MRHFAALMIVAALAAGIAAPGIAAGPNSGPGRVRVGVDASIWDSSVATDVPAGIFPIGGSGQLNGEFTTAERYGIQIGLRAQERFQGPLTATTGQSPDVGVYEATANATAGPAAWNYDWHVDLRNAKGVARGKTIADYDLVLETDMFTGYLAFPPRWTSLLVAGFQVTLCCIRVLRTRCLGTRTLIRPPQLHTACVLC
jgi:hypothetical protein